MQSSPSPNSIITSINQSNYLCSQTPDPQTSSPQRIPYKDNDVVFQKPMQHRSTRQPPFKQVVIVQKTQNTNVIQRVSNDCTQSKKNYIVNRQLAVSYKSPRNDNLQSEKHGNYDFKNLVINNYVQGYSNNQEIFETQQSKRNEVYTQQTLKINSFNYEKQKFFLSSFSDNGMRVATAHNDAPPPYGGESPLRFSRENEKETAKDKANESTRSHRMTINDETISNEKRQNIPSNECAYNTSNDNQE